MKKPSSELLRTLLRYDEETGRLYWLERPVSSFKDGAYPAKRVAAIWNAKHAGKEAMTAMSRQWKVGNVLGTLHPAHRIIWAMLHDEWPESIDHINGNGSDNRLVNLRAADHRINGRNARRPTTNTSGTVGVSRRSDTGRWAAYVGAGPDRQFLGNFDSVAEAATARKAAERELGYHPNHGRAA